MMMLMKSLGMENNMKASHMMCHIDAEEKREKKEIARRERERKYKEKEKEVSK